MSNPKFLTISEARQLLDILEQKNSDITLRVTVAADSIDDPYALTGFMVVLEHSAWNEEELVFFFKSK